MRRVMDNRYTVLRALGSGGVGEVFLARDGVLNREIAIKVLSRRCAVDGRFAERFRREARSAAALSHPNVVAVHDFGEDRAEDGPDGATIPYIVMEYVPGVTLADLLKERGALSPGTAAAVALGAARGLEAAHRHGVVHRDIKPANILLASLPGGTEDVLAAGPDAVKVADFGVARSVTDGTLTEENAVVGTAHYLSPEQATGRPAGPASDLYSLGVVLYEMLTGRRPFEAEDAESPLAVAMRHATEEPDPPSESNPEVPPALDALVMRLLAKDPEGRPGSAALPEELGRMVGADVANGGPDSTSAGIGVPGHTVEVGEPETLRIPLPAEASRGEQAEREEDDAGTVRRGSRFRLAVPAAVLLVLTLLAVSAGALGGEHLRVIASWVPIDLLGPEAPDADEDAQAGEAANGDAGNGDPSGGEDAGGAATTARTGTVAEPQQGRDTTGADEPADSDSGTNAGADADARADPEEAARRAAVEYYEAVDRESWAYTYSNLDSRSRAMFTEREWYQKNQWFADNDGLDLYSMDVSVTGMSPAGDLAEVNVRRTFENGVVIDRDTIFVFEDGSWKHRLVGNELIFFMPGATYEEFVEAQ